MSALDVFDRYFPEQFRSVNPELRQARDDVAELAFRTHRLLVKMKKAGHTCECGEPTCSTAKLRAALERVSGAE